MGGQEGLLDPAARERLRAWLADDPVGTAWVTGHPGSGMTTLVRGLVRGMGAVWLTPATMRSRAFFRDVCENAVSVTGLRKVVVLDELDVVLGNETAMMDVAHVVRHSARVPVVCILKNSRAALTCGLRKKAALVVDFPRPTHEAMVRAVAAVARAEGLAQDRVEALCVSAPGDVRHVLQTLRADAPATRDVGMATADAVASLLGGGHTVDSAMRLFWGDTGGVPSGVFEAYTQACGDDVRACVAFAEAASRADLVDAAIHGTQRWELMEAYGVESAAAAGVGPPRRARALLDKYGTVWNKAYMQCSKAKAARGVNAKRAAAGLCALASDDMGLLRLLLRGAVERSAGEAAALAREAGLDPAAFLHVMRLWQTGYKLSTHARLKKAWGAPA